jgi:hypothetical protein
LIEKIEDFLSIRDMERFKRMFDVYVEEGFVEEDELEVYDRWCDKVRYGETEVCWVSTGVKTREVEEFEDEENPGFEEPNKEGRRYILAMHQLSALGAWLECCSDSERKVYCQFEVSYSFF